VKRIVLPRLLRVASFRFAALYVIVFAGSALVLGVTVFLKAGSALQEQMTARIETEAAFLREEFQADGVAHLIDVVRARGQGAGALDCLLYRINLARILPARCRLRRILSQVGPRSGCRKHPRMAVGPRGFARWFQISPAECCSPSAATFFRSAI